VLLQLLLAFLPLGEDLLLLLLLGILLREWLCAASWVATLARKSTFLCYLQGQRRCAAVASEAWLTSVESFQGAVRCLALWVLRGKKHAG
jgi:hypothetical protein